MPQHWRGYSPGWALSTKARLYCGEMTAVVATAIVALISGQQIDAVVGLTWDEMKGVEGLAIFRASGTDIACPSISTRHETGPRALATT